MRMRMRIRIRMKIGVRPEGWWKVEGGRWKGELV